MQPKTHYKRPNLDTSHPAIKKLDAQVKADSDIQRMRDDDADCNEFFAMLTGQSAAAGSDDDS